VGTSFHPLSAATTPRPELPMTSEVDGSDWAAMEWLLKTAHAFTHAQKLGTPKEELENLRLEFARALKAMGKDLHADTPTESEPPS
jgi:hypothetical protein